MGTRSNLYAGQPGATATTLVTSPASTVTNITRAWAKNTGSGVETLNITMNGLLLEDNFVLQPGGEGPIFSALGTLNAAQTLVVTASTASTINVVIDGYQVTTS